MLRTGSAFIDAERAFARAARGRRRAVLLGAMRPERGAGRLRVYEERRESPAGAGGRRIREIPLCSISGTVEPARATQFDCSFRPAAQVRERWQRLWIAEHRGVPLPPISVVPVDDGYAIRDGHHRVSVARARGAVTIDATVE
jgi:hypothetical protein